MDAGSGRDKNNKKRKQRFFAEMLFSFFVVYSFQTITGGIHVHMNAKVKAYKKGG